MKQKWGGGGEGKGNGGGVDGSVEAGRGEKCRESGSDKRNVKRREGERRQRKGGRFWEIIGRGGAITVSAFPSTYRPLSSDRCPIPVGRFAILLLERNASCRLGMLQNDSGRLTMLLLYALSWVKLQGSA